MKRTPFKAISAPRERIKAEVDRGRVTRISVETRLAISVFLAKEDPRLDKYSVHIISISRLTVEVIVRVAILPEKFAFLTCH